MPAVPAPGIGFSTIRAYRKSLPRVTYLMLRRGRNSRAGRVSRRARRTDCTMTPSGQHANCDSNHAHFASGAGDGRTIELHSEELNHVQDHNDRDEGQGTEGDQRSPSALVLIAHKIFALRELRL